MAMKRLFAGLLALIALAQGARAQIELTGITTEEGSAVTIKVLADFQQIPSSGFIPLRVKIDNGTRSERTWAFTTQVPGIEASASLTVQSGESRTFPIMVPIEGETAGRYLQVSINGYGVKNANAMMSNRTETSNPPTPYMAMSKMLAANGWSPLKDYSKAKSRELFGSEFSSDQLPADWRGYVGVASLWITDVEWERLPGEVTLAIRSWIQHGGSLVLMSATGREPKDFGFTRLELGFGKVTSKTWSGKYLDEKDAFTELIASAPVAPKDPAGSLPADWKLTPGAGIGVTNAPLIIGFMVSFGVIIGPVNLFWLARRERRYRMFWTTPLIAVAGSAALMAVIVIQDGFGGAGNRVAIVHLLPASHQAVVVQEQVSRTGVLLSGSFSVADEAMVTPLGFQSSTDRWGRRGSSTKSLKANGRSYSGQWFESRAIQGQLIETQHETRQQLQLVAGAGDAPTLQSSLETTLGEVYYHDAAGKFWYGKNLGTGQRLALQAATPEAFLDWCVRLKLEQTAVQLNERLRSVIKREGYFFALAQASERDAVATVPSIRWRKTDVIYTGPLAELAKP